MDRNTLEKKLFHRTGKAIHDYRMILGGDRILVAVSGGKDSWVLLHVLLHLQRVSPVRFELVPVTIDPGFPEFDSESIGNAYRELVPELPWTIVRTEINQTIAEKNLPGKYPCAFCARLRRGALYRVAASLDCNRIALGHHADDAVETLLLSGFFEGKLVSLPPVMKPARYALTVIRPLIRVWEEEIRMLVDFIGFPGVSCGHEADSGGKRDYIKGLLAEVQRLHPVVKQNLLAALHTIRPDHFLDNKWL